MYRALAKEIHAKEGAIETGKFQKNSDRGKNQYEQRTIQRILVVRQKAIETSLKELLYLKSQLDNQLFGTSTNNLSHLIIESNSPMPVAVSAIISPDIDFNGNKIQNLIDLSIPAEQLVFNSFSSDGKGYIVFSWLKSSTKVLGFINSLLQIQESEMFTWLIRFFLGCAENCFISPSWWNNLTTQQTDKIHNLVMSGVRVNETSLVLVDDGINFSGWEIDYMNQINF